MRQAIPHLLPVPSPEVEAKWHFAEPWVRSAVDEYALLETVESYKARCLDRSAQLWLIADQDQVVGCGNTEIYPTNKGMTCAVPVLAAVSFEDAVTPEGTALEPWARLAGALAGGQVANAAQRSVTPLPTDHVRQQAVRTLKSEGVIDLTAGQETGRHALRWAESASKDTAFSGGKAAEKELRQAEQFTRAALRRAGIDADSIDALHQHVASLVKAIGQRECANYLANAGYASS
jgi:hypothetical protein